MKPHVAPEFLADLPAQVTPSAVVNSGARSFWMAFVVAVLTLGLLVFAGS